MSLDNPAHIIVAYHREQSARHYAKARDLVTGYGMTRAVYSVMWWQSRDNWTEHMGAGRMHHEMAEVILLLVESLQALTNTVALWEAYHNAE